MNLRVAVEQFLQHLQASGFSCHTIRSYRHDLARLIEFIGPAQNVRRIEAPDLSRFLVSSQATDCADGRSRGPGAVNRTRAAMRSLFGWLHTVGAIAHSPAAAIRVRSARSPASQVLTQAELKALGRAVRQSGGRETPRDRLALELLAGTGIRVSELVALRREDIALPSRTFTIHSKGDRVETRFLTPSLVRRLKVYLSRLEDGQPWLFPNNRGGHITTRHLARRVDQLRRQAGIERRVSPHDFRHTLATRLLAQTGNLRLVQRALGHRSITSTERYAAVPDKALRAALAAL